jgi:hypothetical protein
VLSLTVAAAVVHDSRREADHRVALALLAAALPGLWAGAEVLHKALQGPPILPILPGSTLLMYRRGAV